MTYRELSLVPSLGLEELDLERLDLKLNRQLGSAHPCTRLQTTLIGTHIILLLPSWPPVLIMPVGIRRGPRKAGRHLIVCGLGNGYLLPGCISTFASQSASSLRVCTRHNTTRHGLPFVSLPKKDPPGILLDLLVLPAVPNCILNFP